MVAGFASGNRRNQLLAFQVGRFGDWATDNPSRKLNRVRSAKGFQSRFGSMARLLGHYVREEKLFPLEEAVRKVTSLPARRLGLLDRGLLRPGMIADVVVFDPAKVNDVATYERPKQFPEGIATVVVNGEPVLVDGVRTEARPGRALLHPIPDGLR